MIHAELTWEPVDSGVQQALERVLRRWAGTPYAMGQGTRGVATDCVGFVCGALADLYQKEIPRTHLAEDASLHRPEISRQVMRKLLEAFPSRRISGPSESVRVQPGDVIIVGQKAPEHALLVGPAPGLWECLRGRGVVRTGLALDRPLQAIYRPLLKDSWRTS
jgi:cell wall-associated NlpC family hydrolase